MYQEEFETQEIVTKRINVSLIPNSIIMQGSDDSLNLGKGSIVINSIGKTEDGTLMSIGHSKSFDIESNLGTVIEYKMGEATKSISIGELFLIMRSVCEETWAGTFEK